MNSDLYPSMGLCCQSTDGDICIIDSHGRSRLQRSAMGLKNYLHSTITTERVSELALMHIHKDTELDAEHIIHQLSRQKNRHLALLFSL